MGRLQSAWGSQPVSKQAVKAHCGLKFIFHGLSMGRCLGDLQISVKSENHCSKQLVGLTSSQLSVDSGRAAATGASEWWGDAVGDAGVVPNGASDGSPSAQRLCGKAICTFRRTQGNCWHHSGGPALPGFSRSPGEPSPGQTPSCHFQKRAPIPNSSGRCLTADWIINQEK